MPGKRKSKETRKQEILEAAFNVAVREGVSSVTTRAVAAQAGLSNGLVHFHYPGKEALMKALLELLLNWLNNDEGQIRDIQKGESCYLNGLVNELKVSADDRVKMKLLLEFWIISLHNDTFKNILKEAGKTGSAYFTSLFEEDKKQGLQYTQQLEPANLNALSIALILGSSLQELLDENWTANSQPWKILEDILR